MAITASIGYQEMHIRELIECFAWLIPLQRKPWFSQQKSFAFIPVVASLKPRACAKILGFLALKSSFLSNRKEISC